MKLDIKSLRKIIHEEIDRSLNNKFLMKESYTLFSCRSCGRFCEGTTDGAVAASDWHEIENIDGPNFVCDECVFNGEADDFVTMLRVSDEYPNARISSYIIPTCEKSNAK